MKHIDEEYMAVINKIIGQGKVKENRTGTNTTSVSGAMFEWKMEDGFPLLTTKKMAWKTIRVELEGFIKGKTSKQWYKDRGCNIWNEWCNPTKVPYGQDAETRAKMAAEDDLGPIYGAQWRGFNGFYDESCYMNGGTDQLAIAIDKIKNNPNCRRNLVIAWNPWQLNEMALVPCHYAYQFLVNDGVVDLLWNQRSVDTFLGLPFNIASYALLLELVAKECGLKAGKLIGFLADVHIYENHEEQIKEQKSRESFPMAKLNLDAFTGSIDDFEWDQAVLEGYECHGPIKAEVAI